MEVEQRKAAAEKVARREQKIKQRKMHADNAKIELYNSQCKRLVDILGEFMNKKPIHGLQLNVDGNVDCAEFENFKLQSKSHFEVYRLTNRKTYDTFKITTSVRANGVFYEFE